MKLTVVPWQIAELEALIETKGVTILLTLIVMVLLTTTEGDVHAKLLVNWQLTISPLFNVELVNTLLFVPTFTPFISHWY